MGYIYLILQTDSNDLESYKIGITKNKPTLRLKQLQTGNPNKLTLLKQYETENYLKVERWLHRKHCTSRTEASNEWRNLDSESVSNFLLHCAEADDAIKFLKENNHFYE